MINYVPAVTAIGHSSVWSGSIPALTGIAANTWFEDGAGVYCCQDSAVKSVGSDSKEGQMSPHRFQASTIGDQLKLATDFRSKVTDAAYWWDESAGHFVTSTYYMKQLPQWVIDFNKLNQQKSGTNVKTSDKGVGLTFGLAEAAVESEQLGQHSDPDLLCISVSSTDAIGHVFSTRGPENKCIWSSIGRWRHSSTYLTRR